MRVFVQVGCEIDPTIPVLVDRTSGAAKTADGDKAFRVAHWGRLAMEAALSLGGVEVSAFVVGENQDEALTFASAQGAVHLFSLQGKESFMALSCWFQNKKPDLVIAQKPSLIAAAFLSWAHVSAVESIEVVGNHLKVIRSLGKGNREELEVKLPAVLSLEGKNPLRYVALSRLKSAGKEIQREEIQGGTQLKGDLSPHKARTRLSATPQGSTPGRNRLSSLLATTQKPKVTEIQSSGGDMADQFVRYLAHHGLLEGSHVS